MKNQFITKKERLFTMFANILKNEKVNKESLLSLELILNKINIWIKVNQSKWSLTAKLPLVYPLRIADLWL